MPCKVGYLCLIIRAFLLSHVVLFMLGRYCIADDKLVNAIEFLDLGDGAGWELLQVYTTCLLVWATISAWL
jgi:hypothetical protein